MFHLSKILRKGNFSSKKIIFSTKTKKNWSIMETNKKMYSASRVSWKSILQRNRNIKKHGVHFRGELNYVGHVG